MKSRLWAKRLTFLSALLTALSCNTQAALALTDTQAADETKSRATFEALNNDFRALYQKAKERIMDASQPLLICYSDHMVLLDGDKRDEINFIPAKYTRLKTVDHIPLALFVLLDPHKDKLLDHQTIVQLQKLKTLSVAVREALSELNLDGETLDRQYKIIDKSVVFIDRAVGSQSVSAAHLTAFCRELREAIMQNAAQAVGAQLSLMDKKMVEWKDKLGEERFKNLQIAIVSGHMPREEHSCFQYFARVYGVRREGLQIVYSEGLAEEKPTRELVATHILDATIGEAFFREKLRMHRDLLSDGAREYLEKHPPKAKI